MDQARPRLMERCGAERTPAAFGGFDVNQGIPSSVMEKY